MQRMGFESRRMGALVEDLLTLIQADAERTMTHESVDLAELLTGVVDDAAVIDPTRTWRLAGGYGPAVVLGDRLRLHQLFANLLANVRTHTQPGTTATVSVLPGLRRDRGHRQRQRAGGVRRGPAAAVRPVLPGRRVAQPGERRHRVSGLSIVAAIVRSHGGQILASHTPGRRSDHDGRAAPCHRHRRGTAAGPEVRRPLRASRSKHRPQTRPVGSQATCPAT